MTAMKLVSRLLLLAFLLWGASGCSSGGGACPAPTVVDAPKSVAAGAQVTVELKDLWAGCNDTGGKSEGARTGTVTVELIRSTAPAQPIPVESGPISDSASAKLSFQAPDASGQQLTLRLDGSTLAIIQVT